MARLRGPLFSQKASKQLGKKLIYKTRGNKSLLTKYNKPGGFSPFNPSPDQIDQRMLYNLIVANWQVKTPAQKKILDDWAESKNLKMSGWNFLLREALKNLPYFLELQGYWAFNQIVGGEILDLSGNENHGTLKPSYPSDSPFLEDSINRKFGKACRFDGNNDYINCGLDESLDLIYTLTLEAWIKANKEPGYIVAKYDDNDSQYSLLVNNDILNFVYWNGSTIVAVPISTTIIRDDKWHHVAVTILGTEVKGYVDGNLELTPTLAAELTSFSSVPVYIGARKSGAGQLYFFRGLIDEVRIYSWTLTEEEIKKHYDLKFK